MKTVHWAGVLPALAMLGCDAPELAPSAANDVDTVREALSSSATTQNWVKVIVNSVIYPDLTAELATLKADMQAEGWSVTVEPFTGTTATELKSSLQQAHSASSGRLAGAFLIGDMPFVTCNNAWNKAGTDANYCDYWYMDLDGTWLDADGDGILDGVRGGQFTDRTPEIFVGRLTATNVNIFPKTELNLLKDYLKRNHRFRAGFDVPTPKTTAAFPDGDQNNANFYSILTAQQSISPNTVAMGFEQVNGYATSNGYGDRWSLLTPTVHTRGKSHPMFLEDMASGPAYSMVVTHGWGQGWMEMADVNDLADLVKAGRRLPYFLVSHACSSAPLAETNAIANVATLGGTMAFIGGSATTFFPPEFDRALISRFTVQATSIGAAMKDLHDVGFASTTDTSLLWTSANLMLIGDPTLRRSYPAATVADPDFVNPSNLEVWLADNGSSAASTAFKVYVKNAGTSSVSLAGVDLRYELMQTERPSATLVVDDAYTPATTPQIFWGGAMAPDRRYVNMRFGNVTLAPGAVTSNGANGGEQVRVHFSDWQEPWREYNDYSAADKTSTWKLTKRINLYRNTSDLLYGYAR